MTVPLGTIRTLRSALANGITSPSRLANVALSNANHNPSQNTYLWQNPDWTRTEAARAEAIPIGNGAAFGDGRGTLWGLPISIKDCFDLAGAPTSCGVRFYREKNGIAARDSWIVAKLRAAGAVVIGKTHLHPLAYGITGENSEFGDCIQPGTADALTGGSSSGAAASVMEGSAVAAIGTDTGGSIRVPAALCGLAGYRSSLGRGDWRGGAHLAPSFDTIGWLFRDLEEAPLLAWPFASEDPASIPALTQFAFVEDDFLHDCEPAVIAAYRTTIAELEAIGLHSTRISVSWWSEAPKIFAPIQASEAAGLHRGHFDEFEPAIRDRLEWGSRISSDELALHRERHLEFRVRMDDLFAKYHLILMPAAPVAALIAGADHSSTRGRLLRYTTPFSLAGAPAVTIPCVQGGVQMAAARNNDEALLQIAALIGAHRKAAGSAYTP